MKLTPQQILIINSEGDIKINAVAGSGKTTTVVEYAKARPKNSKILYLAFNKSVKLEAIRKFGNKKLYNVTVETAHSIAYKNIVRKNGYTVNHNGYKIYEIVDLLDLQVSGEKHTKYVVANHILKFVAYFCNSDKSKINQLNYLDLITDEKAKKFVQSFYPYIEKQCRILLAKMNSGEIEISHDFYLKKFQLSNPVLNYDYILFDEGQDASPAMLDVFLNQTATKVIVGDTHQQIYGWRHAVNSLEKTHFTTYNLSNSFRFGQAIANLAMAMLNLKAKIGAYKSLKIKGSGTSKSIGSKATLARTNLGLLLKAIEFVTENRKKRLLYFEGNINSYTYADDGASLYDVLNLFNGKRRLIRDKLIKQMQDIPELEDYIEKTEDVQLKLMVKIVKEYENEIPKLLRKIKSWHVENDEKEKAEMIFSTVHRCKGMEYDSITLVNDFINEKKLTDIETDIKAGLVSASKLNEEINLLYVAVTRTKNIINIPEELIPENFPKSPFINVIPIVIETEKEDDKKDIYMKVGAQKTDNNNNKAYNVTEIRKKMKGAYMPWTDKLDEDLTEMFCLGSSVKLMATHFGRTSGAIYARIQKLELHAKYE